MSEAMLTAQVRTLEECPAKLRVLAASSPTVRWTLTADEARRAAAVIEAGLRLPELKPQIDQATADRATAERLLADAREALAKARQLMAMAAAMAMAALVIALWL